MWNPGSTMREKDPDLGSQVRDKMELDLGSAIKKDPDPGKAIK
jgi:hypothetical protein